MQPKKPGLTGRQIALIAAATLLGLVLLRTCSVVFNGPSAQRETPPAPAETVRALAPASSAVRPAAPPTPASAPLAAPKETRKWYEGGTLQNAGALAWQTATPENKLATCSDFIAALWMKNKLSPKLQSKIESVDDTRAPAAELVKALDIALAPDADAAANRQKFTNQKVSEIAAMNMIMMGYVQQ